MHGIGDQVDANAATMFGELVQRLDAQQRLHPELRNRLRVLHIDPIALLLSQQSQKPAVKRKAKSPPRVIDLPTVTSPKVETNISQDRTLAQSNAVASESASISEAGSTKSPIGSTKGSTTKSVLASKAKVVRIELLDGAESDWTGEASSSDHKSDFERQEAHVRLSASPKRGQGLASGRVIGVCSENAQTVRDKTQASTLSTGLRRSQFLERKSQSNIVHDKPPTSVSPAPLPKPQHPLSVPSKPQKTPKRRPKMLKNKIPPCDMMEIAAVTRTDCLVHYSEDEALLRCLLPRHAFL